MNSEGLYLHSQEIGDLDSALLLNLIKQIGVVCSRYPEANLADALSYTQLKSKIWLINEIKRSQIQLGDIFILGGWYGLLGSLLLATPQIKIKRIRSFDKDPLCEGIADDLNRLHLYDAWKFKAVTQDVLEMSFEKPEYTIRGKAYCENFDSIINTSCEHFENWNSHYRSLPNDKLLILQSNNFFSYPTHTNCVNDLVEFQNQCPMRKLIYAGELDLGNYKRFMLIGYK